MPERVRVYYEGWGERWLRGTLESTTAVGGRPQIVFEYRTWAIASQFVQRAASSYPGMITQDTLQTIQRRIDENIALLR